MAQTRRALTPAGTLISNGGGHAGGKLARTLRTMLVSIVVKRQASPTVKTQNHDDLVALRDLVEAGKVSPVIDGTYPLDQTATGDRARGGRPHAGNDRDLGLDPIARPGRPRPSPNGDARRCGRRLTHPKEPTQTR
jgi:NADPH:quinone reductase-like Zn-dependent oxidoreductase